MFWVDDTRCGTDPVGGIFWCDFVPFTPSDPPWDVPQVFGHTASGRPTLRRARGLKLIDVDAGMCACHGGNRAYLEIRADGRIVQHAKKGTRWTSKILGARSVPE